MELPIMNIGFKLHGIRIYLFEKSDNVYCCVVDITFRGHNYKVGDVIDLSLINRETPEKNEYTIMNFGDRIELRAWCPAKLLY